MLASSVFVLTALTVTGLYVRKSNRAEREEYVVDFETLEQSSEELAENMVSGEELDTLFAEVGTDDLDYDRKQAVRKRTRAIKTRRLVRMM